MRLQHGGHICSELLTERHFNTTLFGEEIHGAACLFEAQPFYTLANRRNRLADKSILNILQMTGNW
jgi:hypothetical protein